ncbi:hypothetical protein OSW16_22500 [Pseudomonas putida]|uniref:hypothetical protein n=1 Tax=Pseudomonas putida TaxID=303 RepID=UPI00227131EE|nr:hypothetical protein [Pseudomonas putida]WAB97277.1 hypothetical protein OSW16_22500 [Pseudomonas putida]
MFSNVMASPDAAQYSSMQLNIAQYSSIQLNPAQSSSIQLNPAQSSSIQLNPAQSSSIQLNPAQRAEAISLLNASPFQPAVFDATPMATGSPAMPGIYWPAPLPPPKMSFVGYTQKVLMA